MAHIQVGDLTPRNQYTATASQTTFTYSFPVFVDADLKIYVGSTLKTLTTDYTVTGAGADAGGTIVFGTGLSSGDIVTIYRDMAVSRTSDYQANGDLLAATLNDDLDKNVMMAQQNEQNHNLTLKVDQWDTYTDLTLPAKTTRAGTVLGFNATTGDPEAGPTIADVSSLAAITADIATLADIEDGTDATDAIQTVAGISSNVTTVAGVSGNVTTVAGISSDVTAVAGDATDIGAVAAKATEIGRLGTADAVADMAILGTTDVVADMNTLATADVVSDLNTLGTADVVADMNVLATADVVADMNTLATADIVADMNTLATADVVADMNTLATADIVADMNTLGTTANVTNMDTCADNITGINSFADRYRVVATEPATSNDEGDLYFNTTSNTLFYYNGTAWSSITTYSHPTGDGNLHVPATGTTNNEKVLTAGATAGSLSWATPSGGGATGGGTDEVFYENGQTVTTNYTLTTNTNAMSAGDITINSGVTVTVPSGSNWVIV